MPAEAPSKQTQLDKVLSYILDNQATWIADIGLRARFFYAFAEAGQESLGEETPAQRFGYPLRPVQIGCHSAYAYGFLDWEEGSGYRMAPHMAALLLDPADPSFLRGRIHFYAALNEDYRSYPDFLRLGEARPRRGEDSSLLTALQNLTKPDAIMITDHVLPQSPTTLARLEGGGNLLDVGAGEGDHVIHYGRRFPNAHVVGLEIDAARAEVAWQKVTGGGLAGRVEIRQGDANQLEEKNFRIFLESPKDPFGFFFREIGQNNFSRGSAVKIVGHSQLQVIAKGVRRLDRKFKKQLVLCVGKEIDGFIDFVYIPAEDRLGHRDHIHLPVHPDPQAP